METARTGRFIETTLIAFFAGTVSCVLTASLFVPDSPSPPAMRTPDVSRSLGDDAEGLAEALARIEADVSSLSAEVAKLDHRRTPVADASIGEKLARIHERLEAVDPGSAMRTQELTGEGWASVIDGELARCLVEHAKTPFDGGVAPLLRQATRELAAIEDEYSESRRLMSAGHKQLLDDAVARSGGQLMEWAPPMGDLQALADVRNAGMEGTLTRFRNALVALN